MSKNVTNGSLAGKTALITGAGKRLGRETALALATAGVNVVIHYATSEKEATEVTREAISLGVKSWKVNANFEDSSCLDSFMDEVYGLSGTLDILVNSASIFPTGKFKDITLEDVNTNVLINAWTPFQLSRIFRDKSKTGSIVNFLDTRLKGYDFDHAAYYLSKHMLAVITQMMAIEFAPNISVNAVSPGLVLPPPGKDEQYLEALKGTLPLGRVGTAKEVTEAVLFLLRSEFITGQVIYVDGGRHIRGGPDVG